MSVESVDKIVTQCGACSGRMRVPAQAVGKKVRCPKCSEPFVVAAIPAANAKPVTAQSSAAAPAVSAAVKKVRPAAARPAAPPPPAPAVEEASNDDDLFAELARQSGEATAEPIRMPAMELPSAPVAKKAAGKRGSVSAGGSALAGLAGAAAGQQRFIIGCVLSAIGAGIGAGIWYGIAMATGKEYGYVGALVGFLGGLGMAVGAGGGSTVGGVVASVMTLVIFGATRMTVISNMVDEEYNDILKDFVAMGLAGDIAKERKLDLTKLSEADAENCHNEAESRVKSMRYAELENKADHYRQQMRAGGLPEDIILEPPPPALTQFFDSLGVASIVGFLLAMAGSFRMGAMGFAAFNED